MNNLTSADNWRATLAEFIATYFFVFVGVGSVGAMIALTGNIPGTAGVILIGLGHGLAIAVGVAAIGRISGGHINPAITVAALITGNIGVVRAALYIVGQLAGAVLAVFSLKVLAYDFNNLGVHSISSTVGTAGAGFAIEAILTFFLVFTVFAVALDRRGNAVLAPLAIGTVMALDHFVAIPLTGASMNPARSFGPALVSGAWDNHWVYWAGPIVGGVIAAIGYVLIFGDEEARNRAGTISIAEPPVQAQPAQGKS
ncbi:MAG: aquaporin [Dehalococcoidia bacterium]